MNAFSSLLGIGEPGGGKVGNALNRFSEAFKDPAIARQEAEKKAAAESAADDEADKFIGLALDAVTQAPPEQRAVIFGTFRNLASARGFDKYIDPRELQEFEANLGNDVFLQGVRAQYGGLDLKDNIDQRLTGQKHVEDARSNRADEGLRASGQAIDRERLALDRTGGAENFGVTPQFVRMQDGSIRAVQFSSQGRILQQDLGGTPVRFDPALEQELAAGRETGKVVGTARGDAIAGLGAQEAAVTKLNTDIDRLLTGDLSAGRRAAFGFRRPDIAVLPGEPRKDAEALVKQIAANLTIENVSKLKGPLSDKDIAFLKEASTRLSNQDISDFEAERVLTEVREFLNQNVARSRGRAGVAAPTQGSDDVDSLLRKYGVQ